MYYCFVEEDLADLCDNDQLIIQANYAKCLGLYCCCRLSEKTIVDQKERIFNTDRKCILLRATCSTMQRAASLLKENGANLFETLDDISVIEHWDSMYLTQRRILTVQFKEISHTTFTSQIEAFLLATPIVFVKSRKKGFCVQLPSRRLLQGDPEILAFFKKHCKNAPDELLLSEALSIKTDSLGLKESRHFVFNGIIVNSSRTLHSVKHAVPLTLRSKAASFVKTISAQNGFPKNYVIDVGEFDKNGETFIDIIELNPITSSLCYVNNSIFNKVIPEVSDFKKKTGMGAEYCYDAINYPNRYIQTRHSNACYIYTNTEHYSFS